MMSMSPRPSLKFRKADFLRYGFKAGISDGAFLSTASSSRRAVCLRPSYAPLPVASYPRSKSRDAVRWRTSVQAAQAALPQGSSLRSELYCLGPSSLKSTPSVPLASTFRLRRLGLYEMSLLCALPLAPRRPATGSELSLAILYRHVIV